MGYLSESFQCCKQADNKKGYMALVIELEMGPNGLKWTQSKHESPLGWNLLPNEPKIALFMKLRTTPRLHP